MDDSTTQPYTPSVSVVIPAMNEAENLYHVLPLLPSIVSEVILIDGNSTDDTIAVAKQLLPSIRIIRQQGKGKGDALRIGFAACTGEIIVMLDADGSANPCEIPQFVDALIAGNEYAKGSRFLKGGGSADITPLRRSGNSMLCFLVNSLFNARFTDLCYGYNAFWRRSLTKFDIDCDGFEVETLLNLRVHQANLRTVEVPSFEHRRIYGQSNLRTFRDGWRVLRTIMRERTRKVALLPAQPALTRKDVLLPAQPARIRKAVLLPAQPARESVTLSVTAKLPAYNKTL